MSIDERRFPKAAETMRKHYPHLMLASYRVVVMKALRPTEEMVQYVVASSSASACWQAKYMAGYRGEGLKTNEGVRTCEMIAKLGAK